MASGALRLWRGPARVDVAFSPLVAAEACRLDDRRLATLELRVEADLSTGRHADALVEVAGLLVEHPQRERLYELQMRALYAAGRRGQALEAYTRARQAL